MLSSIRAKSVTAMRHGSSHMIYKGNTMHYERGDSTVPQLGGQDVSSSDEELLAQVGHFLGAEHQQPQHPLGKLAGVCIHNVLGGRQNGVRKHRYRTDTFLSLCVRVPVTAGLITW